MFSLYSFKDFKYDNVNRLEISALVTELEAQNLRFVYSQGAGLQWQIMFLSSERIIARYTNSVDRYPYYIEVVDAALENPNVAIAMVGRAKPKKIAELPDDIILVANQFFIYPNPSIEELENNGFRFE